MNIPKLSFRCFNVSGAAFALLLFSACSSVPVVTSTDNYRDFIGYEPVRSPLQIEASAAVAVVLTVSPESAGGVFGRFGNNETNIANYRSVVMQTLQKDLTTSGLFARIVANDASGSDYLVKAQITETRPSDFRVAVTLTAVETATGVQVSSHTQEASLGTSLFKYFDNWKEALPGLMAALKADLAADLQKIVLRQQSQASRAEAELLTKASLTDLLVAADRNEALARARNLAIVAAKNQQLPALLRERKTDELSALVVKIEQTILELNHECEVAKDRAQQATTTNGDPRQVEELRGLTISYRERIELLKPILAALKEEIANRSR